MKAKSLHLKNFKRFTELELTNIPENTKLVLLIGSNGSGKSSVFDGFNVLSNLSSATSSSLFNYVNIFSYYNKDFNLQYELKLDTHDKGEISFIPNFGYKFSTSEEEKNQPPKHLFYGRTSFRQVPALTRTTMGQIQFNIDYDNDKPAAFIDRDERLENDLEHLFGQLLKEFFRTDEDKLQIKNDVITPINKALDRIFSKENGTKIELIELIPPIEGKIAEVNFRKGESVFHYHQLSAGEKEVFNILINLVARGQYYQNTIYYFDEIDLHLNTALQYNFLKEIIEHWIPGNCQFWTASHSLGFIQYAKENKQAIIFDFNDYDFDFPKVLSPIPKDNSDIYNIAVSKEILPELFKDYTIIFVENKDRFIYSELNIDKTLFVQENGKNGVYHKIKNGEFKGIIDRDFLSDEDISEIEKQYKSLKILRWYSIENYLYHPDNLEEYFSPKNLEYNKKNYEKKIAEEKNKTLETLIRQIALTRTSYPFFREPGINPKFQKRFANAAENYSEASKIESYLKSENFNDYYKVFPMKDYATQIEERQNLSKIDLAKTSWFKQQIQQLLA